MLEMLTESKLEKITWETSARPSCASDFPCMVCHKEIAIFRLKFKAKEIRLNLILCDECAQLTDSEIWNSLQKK